VFDGVQPVFWRKIQAIQNRQSILWDRSTFAGLELPAGPVQQLQVLESQKGGILLYADDPRE
jgi:hypothetical protein